MGKFLFLCVIFEVFGERRELGNPGDLADSLHEDRLDVFGKDSEVLFLVLEYDVFLAHLSSITNYKHNYSSSINSSPFYRYFLKLSK